jgi:hypothetical protein
LEFAAARRPSALPYAASAGRLLNCGRPNTLPPMLIRRLSTAALIGGGLAVLTARMPPLVGFAMVVAAGAIFALVSRLRA